MINREIKVGDRLRWIDPGRKVRDEVFTVARIDGDYVYDTRDKVYRVLGSTYPHNYEHVNEPQADPVNHSAGDCHQITNTEAVANAELFAAAPEMLACLEELMEWICSGYDASIYDIEEAARVVQKARGEA